MHGEAPPRAKNAGSSVAGSEAFTGILTIRKIPVAIFPRRYERQAVVPLWCRCNLWLRTPMDRPHQSASKSADNRVQRARWGKCLRSHGGGVFGGHFPFVKT